jgi:hypothetical protein
MKFLSILAAASLALAPAIASAGSHPDSTDDKRPKAGGTAVRVIDRSAIPVGAIVIGSLVLIGGVVIAVLSDNGSSSSSSIDTNNGTN